MPKTLVGKWSAGLNLVFLVVVATSVVLVTVLRILHFEDRWWDITVGVLAPVELIAFITGMMAMQKYKDRSGMVYLSIFTGVVAILFAALHSLFIND